MTVHSTEEARIRARIAAHARRLFVEGHHASAAAFSRALDIDLAQVWRVLTGERTPGLLLLLALHERLGADLNLVLREGPAAALVPAVGAEAHRRVGAERGWMNRSDVDRLFDSPSCLHSLASVCAPPRPLKPLLPSPAAVVRAMS